MERENLTRTKGNIQKIGVWRTFLITLPSVVGGIERKASMKNAAVVRNLGVMSKTSSDASKK